MGDRRELEAIFAAQGCTDYRWIEPRRIVTGEWVRMKCRFGCGDYGRNASCPPNVPTVPECRRFFDEYDSGVIFHFAKALADPEQRHAWSRGVNEGLLALERAVFLSGRRKAFLLFMDSCGLCPTCAGSRQECARPRSARPTPEGLGVDVFATVHQAGYPLEVLADYGQTMNRYAFLLIE